MLPPMARVVTVDLNDEAVAYPYDILQQMHVVNDTVGDTPVVVLWASGTASALDAGTVASGRDVGATNLFFRELEGQTLTFRFDGSRITDEQTGSEWDVLGQAVSGELAGSHLPPVVSINHFWFSWAAFKPETRVYQPGNSYLCRPSAAAALGGTDGLPGGPDRAGRLPGDGLVYIGGAS